jgi:predicted RNA binding protein YcfA (HicA-like mRNA interferase family)
MSPRQLPVVSGKRIVRALEKAGFEVVAHAAATANYVMRRRRAS